MSPVTPAAFGFVRAHCVRLETYSLKDQPHAGSAAPADADPSHRQSVEWGRRTLTFTVSEDRFPPTADSDTVVRLRQALLEDGDPCTAAEVADLWKFAFRDELPSRFEPPGHPTPSNQGELDVRSPRPGLWAATNVVLARVEGSGPDRAGEARSLLSALLGRDADRIKVVGGMVTRTLELWAPHNSLDWLIILCDASDSAENEATSLLHTTLWICETAFHKNRHQSREVWATLVPLARDSERLKAQIGRLEEAVNQLNACPLPDGAGLDASLDEADARLIGMMNAQVDLLRSAGLLREMRTTLVANRATIVHHRALLGEKAGRKALQGRLMHTDQHIRQISTELGYVSPLQREAEFAGRVLETLLLSKRYRQEKEGSEARDTLNRRVELLGVLIGAVGIWIGLTSISEALVPLIWPGADGSVYWKVGLIVLPTVFVLGVCGRVVEHLPDAWRAELREWQRLLMPGRSR